MDLVSRRSVVAGTLSLVGGCLGSTSARRECNRGAHVTRLSTLGALVRTEGGQVDEPTLSTIESALGPGVTASVRTVAADVGTERAVVVAGVVTPSAVRRACSAAGLAVARLDPIEVDDPDAEQVVADRVADLEGTALPVPNTTAYGGAEAGFLTFPGGSSESNRRLGEAVATEMGLLTVSVADFSGRAHYGSAFATRSPPVVHRAADGEVTLSLAPVPFPLQAWTDGAYLDDPSDHPVRIYADGDLVMERRFGTDAVRPGRTDRLVEFGDGVRFDLGPLTPTRAAAVYAALRNPLPTALEARRRC